MRLTSRLSSPWARVSGARRSRLAAPLLLIVALVFSGGLYALLAPAQAANKTDDAATIAKGKALFLVGCASCHGKNAEGITTVKGGQYGPSLAGVGAAAVDFQVGTGRMPLAQPGNQAVQKTPIYDDSEIRALSAYVASLAPGPSVPTSSQYETGAQSKSAHDASVVRGGEFFRTNCTACHNFAGHGGALPRGRFAPNLSGVSKKHIYEAMVTGPQQMPVFSDSVLKPADKADVIAYLKATEEVPGYGGFSLGEVGPVAEGLFSWVSLGVIVGFAVWIAAHTSRAKKKKVKA